MPLAYAYLCVALVLPATQGKNLRVATGQVVNINQSTGEITIKTTIDQRRFKCDQAISVSIDGKRASLKDIPTGERVSVTYDAANDAVTRLSISTSKAKKFREVAKRAKAFAESAEAERLEKEAADVEAKRIEGLYVVNKDVDKFKGAHNLSHWAISTGVFRSFNFGRSSNRGHPSRSDVLFCENLVRLALQG